MFISDRVYNPFVPGGEGPAGKSSQFARSPWTPTKRSTAMKACKLVVAFLVLSGCLLVAVGCEQGAEEKEQALAEAEQARSQLEEVRMLLESTKMDLADAIKARDELQELVDAGKARIAELETSLTSAVDEAAGLKEQLAGLTSKYEQAAKEAKQARSLIGTLKAQVAEQVKKIEELQGQIQKLRSGLGAEGEIDIPKSIPAMP